MRTLKKTLCLVLALVMVLGLCAFNVSAAEFTDAAKIEYKEAVGVMQAAGVLSGFEDGSFRPDETLTRAQAATMIACMMGFSGLKGKTEFTDCQGHWAEGAIAFCANEGIVSGYGDGTFGPNDTLTGSQWAVMLVGALGYNHKAEGITGASWEIGVSKKIKALHLSDNIAGFDGTKAISRDQACELGFQTMQADMAKYTPGISVNGVEIPGTTEILKDVTLLGNLGFENEATTGTDAFGRPNVSVWKNAKEEIVYTNAKAAAYTYTVATPVASVANAAAAVTEVNKALKLTGTTKALSAADNATFVVNAVAGTSFNVGDTVEVYLDATSGKVTNVVVARYAMATVDAINARTGRITLSNGLNISKPAAGATSKDYDAVKDFALKDVLAICVDTSKAATSTERILSVVKAGTVEGKITAADTAKNTVTMNGTKYTVTDDAEAAATLNLDGTLYLSPNGTVIGAVGKTTETVENYAFLVATYDVVEGTSYGSAITHYVQAVDMTGKEVSYAYKDGDSTVAGLIGKLVKVTALTGADAGKYSFNATGLNPTNTTLEATAKRVTGTNNYFTSDVIFVYVSGSKETLKITVRSGVQAVKDATNLFYVAKDVPNSSNKTVSTVFINSAYQTPVVTTSDVAFVFGDSESKSVASLTDKDGKAVTGYEKTVYIDGEVATIYVAEGDNDGNLDGFYSVAKDGDLTVLTPIVDASNLEKGAAFGGYFNGLLTYTPDGDSEVSDMPVAADVIVVNLTDPTADPDYSYAGLADLKTATISVVLSADAKTVTTVYITAITAVNG